MQYRRPLQKLSYFCFYYSIGDIIHVSNSLYDILTQVKTICCIICLAIARDEMFYEIMLSIIKLHSNYILHAAILS